MGKQWQDLTPAYRRRLEATGYSQADFEAGVSRKKARGHASTPERPAQAVRNPARYPEYVQRAADRTLRQRMQGFRKRYDIPELLQVIKTPADRAAFIQAWELANSEWRALGKPYKYKEGDPVPVYARGRLDRLTTAHPQLGYNVGFYH